MQESPDRTKNTQRSKRSRRWISRKDRGRDTPGSLGILGLAFSFFLFAGTRDNTKMKGEERRHRILCRKYRI